MTFLANQNAERSHHSATLIVSFYTGNDPTTRNITTTLLTQGMSVSGVEPEGNAGSRSVSIPGAPFYQSRRLLWKSPFSAIGSVVNFWNYRRLIRKRLRKTGSKLVITTHWHDLAALPWPPVKYGFRLACGILDIPVLNDSGRLDRVLIHQAWSRISYADVIWASDRFRAELVRKLGQLKDTPLVCHNVMERDYLPGPIWPRDGWLRKQLRLQGASIGESGGCIVVRTGAIGEYCGIDETLVALTQLPEDVIFLMLGRPNPGYRDQLLSKIARMKLSKRAFFWDRPPDEVWKKSLLGADVGHMIHGPCPDGPALRAYKCNSSLSNYRLFQYLAAGLPILSYDDPRMRDIHEELQCFSVIRHANIIGDLRQTIGMLNSDHVIREKMGLSSRNAFHAKYNWTKQFTPVMLKLKDMICNEIRR